MPLRSSHRTHIATKHLQITNGPSYIPLSLWIWANLQTTSREWRAKRSTKQKKVTQRPLHFNKEEKVPFLQLVGHIIAYSYCILQKDLLRWCFSGFLWVWFSNKTISAVVEEVFLIYMANPATAMEIFRPFSILYFENTRNNKFNANKCHNNPPKKVPPPEKYLQTSQPVQREKTGPFKANQWVQRVDNVFPGGSGSENPPGDKKRTRKKLFTRSLKMFGFL